MPPKEPTLNSGEQPGQVALPVPLAETRALRQSVLRPHQTLPELAAEEPPDAYAVGVREGEELIAVGFVNPEGYPGEWRVRAMATAAGYRGRGLGSAVLRTLVRYAVDHGATRVWCSVRTPAVALYERAGFIVVSDAFEVPKIGPHVVMELRPRLAR